MNYIDCYLSLKSDNLPVYRVDELINTIIESKSSDIIFLTALHGLGLNDYHYNLLADALCNLSDTNTLIMFFENVRRHLTEETENKLIDRIFSDYNYPVFYADWIKRFLEFKLNKSSIEIMVNNILKKKLPLNEIETCLTYSEFEPWQENFINLLSEIQIKKIFLNKKIDANKKKIIINKMSNNKKLLFETLIDIETDNATYNYLAKISLDMELSYFYLSNIKFNRLDEKNKKLYLDRLAKVATLEEINNFITMYNPSAEEKYILLNKINLDINEIYNLLLNTSDPTLCNILFKRVFKENSNMIEVNKVHYLLLVEENKKLFMELLKENNNALIFLKNRFTIVSPEVRNKIIKIICKYSTDLEGISYIIAAYGEELSYENMTALINRIIVLDCQAKVYELYKIALKYDLSEEQRGLIIKELLKINDNRILYRFLRDINLNEREKELIKNRIILNKEIKYICLLAVFIDATLIKKYFVSEIVLFSYIVQSNLFLDEEIIEISEKLFTKKIEQKKIENKINKIGSKKKIFKLNRNNEK